MIRAFFGFVCGALLSLSLIASTAKATCPATDQIVITGALDSRSALTVIPDGLPTYVELQSAASYVFTPTVTDQFGNSHTLYVFLFHTSDQVWSFLYVIDAGDILGGTPGNPAAIAFAQVPFPDNGSAVGNFEGFQLPLFWADSSVTQRLSVSFDNLLEAENDSSLTVLQSDTAASDEADITVTSTRCVRHRKQHGRKVCTIEGEILEDGAPASNKPLLLRRTSGDWRKSFRSDDDGAFSVRAVIGKKHKYEIRGNSAVCDFKQARSSRFTLK